MSNIIEAVSSDGFYSEKTFKIEYNGELVLHRDNGPARIKYLNGSINEVCYYSYGRRHRIGGPAVLKYWLGSCRVSEYYFDGFLHRLDGPACIIGNKQHYWIYGMPYYEKQFVRVSLCIMLFKNLFLKLKRRIYINKLKQINNNNYISNDCMCIVAMYSYSR